MNVVGGREMEEIRGTPGLQSGRCSPADVIADVQILPPE